MITVYLLCSGTAGDGVYSVYDNHFIKLVDLKLNTTKDLVATSDVKDARKISP